MGEAPDTLRNGVKAARGIQYKRLNSHGLTTNAQMPGRLVKEYCVLDGEGETLLHQAMMELGISARGYNKVLKISRTIADLEGSEKVLLEHISEAIQYRSLDRGLWR